MILRDGNVFVISSCGQEHWGTEELRNLRNLYLVLKKNTQQVHITMEHYYVSGTLVGIRWYFLANIIEKEADLRMWRLSSSVHSLPSSCLNSGLYVWSHHLPLHLFWKTERMTSMLSPPGQSTRTSTSCVSGTVLGIQKWARKTQISISQRLH